jgi:uncharacterized protein YydD (DUF2326 family)
LPPGVNTDTDFAMLSKSMANHKKTRDSQIDSLEFGSINYEFTGQMKKKFVKIQEFTHKIIESPIEK